jgi:CoA:oxalate CoA-transferase
VKPTGPLDGIKIIDLSRVLAGPFATMVLSDLGARVIKVERPGSGDDSRRIGPFKKNAAGENLSAYFAAINRAKESIALDLKNPDDRLIFEALLADADVLVENYRPGVMAKLGYGWDALHPQFPRLIYAAASGFGHTGPYKHKPAYDVVVQGMGGIMSITGHKGGPPTRVGTSFGDIVAGLFTVIGIEAALLARNKTGAGQFVDVSMLDGQIAMLENAIVRYGVTGIIPGPVGSRHPSITPFAAFKTKDSHLIIAAGNDELWKALSDALAAPHFLTDPRYASNPLRNDHWADVEADLEYILASHGTSHWISLLEAAGVPCAPINNVAQAMADPQVRARNMIVKTGLEDGTPLEIAGAPIKFSDHVDPPARYRAPRLNEHRAALITEIGSGMLADAARLAHRLVDASGIIIRGYFRQPMTVDAKADNSPVTRADREAESRIRDMIAAAFPGHGVIGEEFGSEKPDAEFVWVIDPIDGTRSFIAGRPIFGTLVALLHNGVPVLGVIDQPIAGDRWIGVQDEPTLLNGAPAHGRACNELVTATIATTGPQYFAPDELAVFNSLAAKCGNVLYGGDCHNYGLLASGHVDIVMEAGLKLHDWAALVPVIAGAGGGMTDWSGNRLDSGSQGQVLAAGRAIDLSGLYGILQLV